MKWRLIAATFAAAVLVGPTQAQEDPGSGNYMLPLCKTWLRMASHDLDVIKDEMRIGNAKPGGIVRRHVRSPSDWDFRNVEEP